MTIVRRDPDATFVYQLVHLNNPMLGIDEPVGIYDNILLAMEAFEEYEPKSAWVIAGDGTRWETTLSERGHRRGGAIHIEQVNP